MKLHQVAIATALATEGLTSPFAVAKAPSLQSQRRRKVIETIAQKNPGREEKKRALQTVLRQRQQLSAVQQFNNNIEKESEELDLGILGSGKNTEHEILDEDFRRLDEVQAVDQVDSGYDYELLEDTLVQVYNFFANILTKPYAYYIEYYCASMPQGACNECGVTYDDSGVYSLKFDCPRANFDASYLQNFELACSPPNECPDCTPICGSCNVSAENLFVDNQNCFFNDELKDALGLDGYNLNDKIIEYIYAFIDELNSAYATSAPTSMPTTSAPTEMEEEVVVEEPEIETDEPEEESVKEPVDISVKEPVEEEPEPEEEPVEVDISGLGQEQDAAAAEKSSAHSSPMSKVLAFVLMGASWCWMAAA